MVYVMRNGRRVIVALSFLLLCCGVHVHAQHNNRNDNAAITLRPFLITYTIIYFPLNISHSIFPHKKGLLSNLYTPWAESHKIRKNIVLKTFKHVFLFFIATISILDQHIPYYR